MLFHFSCPYEKVSKYSTKNIFTQALNSNKKSTTREKMAVERCRNVLTGLFSIILKCAIAMMRSEFFRSGFCFPSDKPEALSYLTGK